MIAPGRCADVTFDMQGHDFQKHDTWEVQPGDLLWNPKMGDGHVIVALVGCGEKHPAHTRRYDLGVDCGCGGWGKQPCPSVTAVCECGEDGSWRDHHYYVLARPSTGTET